jgi:hypothetical protein
MLISIVLLLGIFRIERRRALLLPRGPCPLKNKEIFLKILLLIMIPAPSGSHLKCLKCVKTQGKTFY